MDWRRAIVHWGGPLALEGPIHQNAMVPIVRLPILVALFGLSLTQRLAMAPIVLGPVGTIDIASGIIKTVAGQLGQ